MSSTIGNSKKAGVAFRCKPVKVATYNIFWTRKKEAIGKLAVIVRKWTLNSLLYSLGILNTICNFANIILNN